MIELRQLLLLLLLKHLRVVDEVVELRIGLSEWTKTMGSFEGFSVGGVDVLLTQKSISRRLIVEDMREMRRGNNHRIQMTKSFTIKTKILLLKAQWSPTWPKSPADRTSSSISSFEFF